MTEPELIDGEKILDEIKPQPAIKKQLFASLLVLGGFKPVLKLGMYIWFAELTLVRAALEIAKIMLVYLIVREYLKNHYDEKQYRITNKRLILKGAVRGSEVTLSSWHLLKYGISGNKTVTIPYGDIDHINTSELFLINSLHIKRKNRTGQTIGKAEEGDYILVALPNAQETANKILQFAPWAGQPAKPV